MKKIFDEIIFHLVNNLLFKLLIYLKICFLLLILSVKYVSATNDIYIQQNIVSGKVTDSSSGEPLIGVSVVIKGTTQGTTTNIDGEFSFIVPERENILVFSYIGYITREVNVTSGSPINITLEEDVTELEQVVVVGYGIQKKESVVGAVSQIDNQALVESGFTGITNALTGKMSGVLTIQNTGEPGRDESEIIIRGLSSWNSSAPLILIDGVERDFKNIDPNEVNTISVLKDASATAVFGARGANGVIIVTTKRGSLSEPKFDFTFSAGLDKATRISDHISSYTTLSMYNVALMNQKQFQELISDDILNEYQNPSTRLNSLRYPNVNWFEELSRPFAPTYNSNLNVRGGTNFIKYFASLGHTHRGSFFEGYNEGPIDSRFRYDRINYRGNVDFNLTKLTVLSLNLGGDINITNSPTSSGDTDGIWRALYGTSPARFPAYFPEWVLEEVPDPDYPDASGNRFSHPFFELRGNPYTNLFDGSFNRVTGSKLFTDLIMNQELNFIVKGLSVKGKVSVSTYFANRSLYSSYGVSTYELRYDDIGKEGVNPWYRTGQTEYVYKDPLRTVGVGAMEGGYYTDLYYEMSLNYSNTFGNHRITGLALMNRQQKNAGTDFPYYNAGLVGRTTYEYAGKYLLEFNVGYTGSERFAPGNRFGFFPSAAIGWLISEENFFKQNISWIDKLKIRYSDGLVGSDYARNRWLYISGFTTDSRSNIWEEAAANTLAQWEEARKRDIGIELGFGNKLDLTIDLFDEQRDRMLLEPRSVSFVVGNQFKELNLGELEKHGIEIEAQWDQSFDNGFDYFIKGMCGYNENRIIFKDDPPYAPDYAKQEGKPLGSQINGTVLTGYYNTIDDIHMNPSPISRSQLFLGEFKFLDYNADGQINSLDQHPIKGNIYPPFTYSFGSGFSYKGFEFHFLFAGNVGKYVTYNMNWEFEFNYSAWRVHKSQLDYWRPDNPNATHSSLHYAGDTPPILAWAGGNASALGFNVAIDECYWRNADYLRLRDVYTGYTFKSDFIRNSVGISGIHIYAIGNNLLTLTNLIEGDPERKDFMYGFYPIVASVKFGAKLTF